MKETSKAMQRRNSAYIPYFIGKGIDIGCGTDYLSFWKHKFPLMSTVKNWDLIDGDAQLMSGILPNTFDWVHSSHCLEHMVDWKSALARWIDIAQNHLIITVPSFEMYEHSIWPSRFNRDHKWAFTLNKPSEKFLVNLAEELPTLATVVLLQEITDNYDPLDSSDQTLRNAECCIEFVLKKCH